MAHIRDFRDLIVWQRSVDFIVEVYQLTRRFPVDERYGITSQLRRAAERLMGAFAVSVDMIIV